jgi:hypothetical protein
LRDSVLAIQDITAIPVNHLDQLTLQARQS